MSDSLTIPFECAGCAAARRQRRDESQPVPTATTRCTPTPRDDCVIYSVIGPRDDSVIYSVISVNENAVDILLLFLPASLVR